MYDDDDDDDDDDCMLNCVIRFLFYTFKCLLFFLWSLPILFLFCALELPSFLFPSFIIFHVYVLYSTCLVYVWFSCISAIIFWDRWNKIFAKDYNWDEWELRTEEEYKLQLELEEEEDEAVQKKHGRVIGPLSVTVYDQNWLVSL